MVRGGSARDCIQHGIFEFFFRMSEGGKEAGPPLSEETSRQCQTAITERLASMLGEEGVEILTEYIWHMITRPKTTREHVCAELEEFLGPEVRFYIPGDSISNSDSTIRCMACFDRWTYHKPRVAGPFN